ncbi:MAG: hypothetical protein KAI03_05710 [Candidatus Aureabacteria bacterium]|nr:hypothetical protein [Candidatus Auribacterota bacterium]
MRKTLISLFLIFAASCFFNPAYSSEIVDSEKIKAVSCWIYEYKGAEIIVSFFKHEDIKDIENKWAKLTKSEITIGMIFINNTGGRKKVIFDTQYGGVNIRTFSGGAHVTYDARATAKWLFGEEYESKFSAVTVLPGKTDRRLIMFYGSVNPMDIESVGLCFGGKSTWNMLRSKKDKKYKAMSYISPDKILND